MARALPRVALIGLGLFGGLTSCSVIDRGPDEVELTSMPAGATIELRAPGQRRVMNGVTPMTLTLVRQLPDPLQIIFRLEGHEPFVYTLRKTNDHGLELIDREDWRWPCDPIHVRLLARTTQE